MNDLIFANSLERKIGPSRALRGQVAIYECEGEWRVVWRENAAGEAKDNEENFVSQEEVWFLGGRWNGMLQTFRERLREKMSDGFVPILDGVTAASRTYGDKSRSVLMLQYYGEKSAHPEALQLLRAWRREQAAKDGKAAYIIATNRTLGMVAGFLPHTPEELKQIPGFGESRVQAYGHSILQLTQKYDRQTTFPLDWVAGQLDQNDFEKWIWELGQTKEQLAEEKRNAKRKLLEAATEGKSLEEICNFVGIQRRDAVRMLEELDREGYDVQAVVDHELANVPSDDEAKAWEAFRSVGDRYLKPVLQKLYTEEELKEQDLGLIYERLRLQRLRYRKMTSEHRQAS